MPLYELVCIAKNLDKVKLIASNMHQKSELMLIQCFYLVSSQGPMRDLLKQAAFHVMDRDGVVRSFDNLQPEKLFPYRMKAHQQYFTSGT
jgi:hypothetical protein